MKSTLLVKKNSRGKWTYSLSIIFGLFLFASSFVNRGQATPADSPWPTIHGDSRLSGQSAYDTSKIQGAVKWSFKTDGQTETSPVIASDGTIYIADQKCILYAIDKNGKEKWRYKAGDRVSSVEWGGDSCFQASPSLASDGTIYIAPMSGYMHAITPEGKEKWKYPIFNFKNNWSSPSVGADGTIYLGSESYPPRETGKPEEKSASIYAINPDGTLKWSYDTGGNWSTSTGSIATDGTVYMSGNECKKLNCTNVLFAFNGQSGEIKWTFDHGGVMESSASLGADGTIYFGVKGKDNPRENAKFFAVNPDGTKKWSFDAPCGNSIIPGIANDGTIYWGDWDGAFYAINSDGSIKWKIETPKSFETLSSSPAIGKEGTIYFGSLAGYFYAYSKDGKELWKYYAKEGGINSSPAIGKDGVVYVAFVPGQLVAFGEGKASADDSISESSNKPENSRGLKIKWPLTTGIQLLLGSILFLIISIILALYLKKKSVRPMFWVILIIPFAICVLMIIKLISLDTNTKIQSTSNNPQIEDRSIDAMFDSAGEDFDKTCPERVEVDYSTYTAVLGDKRWEIKNMRQIDWISEKCRSTVWDK